MQGGGDKKGDIWSLGMLLYFMFHYDGEINQDYGKENLPWYVGSVGLIKEIKNNP